MTLEKVCDEMRNQVSLSDYPTLGQINEWADAIDAHLSRQSEGVSDVLVTASPGIPLEAVRKLAKWFNENGAVFLGNGGKPPIADNMFSYARAALTAVWHNRPAQDGDWKEVESVAEDMGRDGGRLHDEWMHRLVAAMPKNGPAQEKAKPGDELARKFGAQCVLCAAESSCTGVCRDTRELDEYAPTTMFADDPPAERMQEKAEPVAEERFEQYVATLIAKAPDVQKLGERLAHLLDDDQFNGVEPILLGIAKELDQLRTDQPAERVRVPDEIDRLRKAINILRCEDDSESPVSSERKAGWRAALDAIEAEMPSAAPEANS